MADNTSTDSPPSSNQSSGGYPRFQLYSDEMLMAYNTFLSLTICFGVPGNLLVLLVFIKTKVTTSTDWFIVFITIFDFISSRLNVRTIIPAMADNTSTDSPPSSNQSSGGYPRFQLYSDEMLMAYNTFLSLTICFGVPGNLLVLLVFIKTKVTTSTDWFIVFITIFDFISSVFNVPVYLTFTNGSWRNYGTHFLCKLHMYFSQVVVLASAFIISGLAVERYIKVCRPNTRNMSKRVSLMTCLVSCLLASLSSIPAAMMYENINGQCLSGRLTTGQMVYFCCVFVLFITVFVVVTFCYTRIILAIRRSTRNVMAHDEWSTSRQPTATPSRSWFAPNKVKPSAYSSTSTDNTDPKIKLQQHSRDASYIDLRKKSDANANNEKPGSTPIPAQDPIAPLAPSPAPIWTVTQYNDTAETGTSQELSAENKKSAISRSTTTMTTRGSSRQSIQTTKIACLVCAIYVLTWIIPWTCFVLMQFVLTVDVLRFALFGRMTYLVNTFTNPFLYAWLNVKFRQKLKSCAQLKNCKCSCR